MFSLKSYLLCFFGFLMAIAWPMQPAVAGGGQLLTIDGQSTEAKLVGCSCDDQCQFVFHSKQGERTISLDQLVRWSTPRDVTPSGQMVLADGSRIVLAESWGSDSSVTWASDKVRATTGLFGQVSIPKPELRAILLDAPSDDVVFFRLLDEQLAWHGPNERLLLAGGDRLDGRLLSIGPSDQSGRSETVVAFESSAGRLKLPTGQVTAILFASPQQENSTQQAPIGVGLQDGSWLVARSIAAGEGSMKVQLGTGIELSGGRLGDIRSLQALGNRAATGRLAYLSDLEASEYQHTPYLGIPWPYCRDRNAQQGQLRVGGKIYPKGLGMHSSSRLTYRVDDHWKMFAAEVAVDNAADGRGSVVFRVLLLRDDRWQVAYESPVVRGGEAPRSVMIDLAGATQIALDVGYADRGDQRDLADWLDARFLAVQAANDGVAE